MLSIAHEYESDNDHHHTNNVHHCQRLMEKEVGGDINKDKRAAGNDRKSDVQGQSLEYFGVKREAAHHQNNANYEIGISDSSADKCKIDIEMGQALGADFYQHVTQSTGDNGNGHENIGLQHIYLLYWIKAYPQSLP